MLVKILFEIEEDKLIELTKATKPFIKCIEKERTMKDSSHSVNYSRQLIRKLKLSEKKIKDLLCQHKELSTKEIYDSIKTGLCYKTYYRFLVKLSIMDILVAKKITKPKGGTKILWSLNVDKK